MLIYITGDTDFDHLANTLDITYLPGFSIVSLLLFLKYLRKILCH